MPTGRKCINRLPSPQPPRDDRNYNPATEPPIQRQLNGAHEGGIFDSSDDENANHQSFITRTTSTNNKDGLQSESNMQKPPPKQWQQQQQHMHRAVGRGNLQDCRNIEGMSEAQISTIRNIDLQSQMPIGSGGGGNDKFLTPTIEENNTSRGAGGSDDVGAAENHRNVPFENHISTSTSSGVPKNHLLLEEIVRIRKDDHSNFKPSFFHKMIADSNRKLESMAQDLGSKFQLPSHPQEGNKLSGNNDATIDLSANMDHFPTSFQHGSNEMSRTGKNLDSSPHEHDVLLGSKNVASHRGNIFLKQLFQKNLYNYLHGTEEQKKLIPTLIYKKITEKLNPPGRFLRLRPNSTEKVWYGIPKENALIFINNLFQRANSSVYPGNDTMPQQSGGAFFNRKKPDKASEKMKALETSAEEIEKKDHHIVNHDIELPIAGCENIASKKRKHSYTNNNNSEAIPGPTSKVSKSPSKSINSTTTANAKMDTFNGRGEKLSNHTLSGSDNDDSEIFEDMSTSNDISEILNVNSQKIEKAERLWEIVPDKNLTYPQRVQAIKLKSSHYGQILHDTLKFSSLASNKDRLDTKSELLKRLHEAEKMWGIEDSEELSFTQRIQKIQSTSKELMEKLQLYA